METFVQLYGHHVFDIPLPDINNPVTYCRECGGIINNKGLKKKYSSAWASEGIIFNNYKKTCEACIKSTKGSSTKALVTPLSCKTVIVHKDGIIPNKLKEIEKGLKKDEYHAEALTLKETIELIPTLPIPYGIYTTIGGAKDVSNIFLKDVHLNYSNLKALIYVVPIGDHVAVSPTETLTLVEEMKQRIAEIKAEFKEQGKKVSDYYFFYRIAEEYNLTPVEKLLFNYLISFKEEK